MANGTYYEHLVINKNVNLVGQSQENTIIDGSNTGRPITINTGANVSISLFTIRNGSIDYGGGIRNEGNLTVTNSTIANNTAYGGGGGGIYSYYGTLVVSDSIVCDNTALYGGGLHNYFGTLEVTNSVISNNRATESVGGGIFNEGTLLVSDSIIKGNVANIAGGGICDYIYKAGYITINNSTFVDNNATNGGGIYNSLSTIVITGSTIKNNNATFGAGIWNHGTLTVSGSTINGNTVNAHGAGIYNYGTVNVTGSTISSNSAETGAGIYNYGTVNVTGSTISGNTATNIAGGIYNGGGTVTVSGSTISGNTAQYGGGIYSSGTLAVNFNRIVGNSPTAIYNDYGSVDAEYNWWGSNNPDFNTLISGVADCNPWLYLTLQVNPNTILQGETSTLTASFNNAFDGTTVTPLNPADGHIPDKTPVTFNTNLGSVGSKTIYKETINGTATATLTADETAGIAHVNAVIDSQTVNTDVTIQSLTPPTASANIKGGLYNTALNVTLTMNEAGKIYYTLDNSTPSNTSTLYTGPININQTTTLKFIAINEAGNPSTVYTETYTIDKTIPTASANIKGGLYNTNKVVNLSMSKPGSIYYTLNGATPTNASTKYFGPITIASSATLKFLAIDNARNPSPVYTEKYVIDKTAPKVVLTFPKNLQTKQSRTATLYLKFSENIKTSTYWSKIYVKDLKTGKKLSITRYIKGNILYIKTNSKRAALRWYQIYIPYKAIKDHAGNNLAKTYTYKFKTRS